jgi:hypothetical protein
MRAHFSPPDESKFMRKHGHQDAPKRHVVSRSQGYPHFNYRRRPIEKAAEKKFRRKMRTRASNRLWAINSALLSEAFSRGIHDVSARTGFVRRLMETPEETATRKAEDFARWKARFLAEQRYLKPRCHPLNMVKPEQLFSGTIGTITSFNLITDAFDSSLSGDSKIESMPHPSESAGRGWTMCDPEQLQARIKVRMELTAPNPTVPEYTKKDLEGHTHETFFGKDTLEKGDVAHVVDGKCVKIERHSNED